MGTISNLRTTPTLSLDDRIANAFDSLMSSQQLEGLLEAVKHAEQAAVDAASEARATALNPATRPAAVADARRAMEDADFRRDRMATASLKLSTLHAEAVKREAWAVIQKDIDKAIAERDALAVEIRDRYPALAKELSDLILRLSANNTQLDFFNRVHGTNLRDTAETIARGVPAHWATTNDGHSQPPLLHSRIPSLAPKDGGYLWPSKSEAAVSWSGG